MRFVFAGLLVAASAHAQVVQPAQRPQPAATIVFNAARARLLDDVERMTRYTCMQNIVRHVYRAEFTEERSCESILAKREKRKQGPAPAATDHLELDVAIANGQEIHSWPGAPKFDEDEIRQLASNGPLSAGEFSAFVGQIFSGGAVVRFLGQQNVGGRNLFAYSFSVPERVSNYQIDVAPGSSVVAAYDGSFLLDPQAMDLVELSLETPELPESTKLCQTLSHIEYGRVDIHDRQILIPRQTDVRMVFRNGREAASTTSYANCHEYSSKSVLRFDDGEVSPAGTAPSPQQPGANAAAKTDTPATNSLPGGLSFECRITTPIDSDMPAGRPLEGMLLSPLRDKSKIVLAAKGSPIRARLVRLTRHQGLADYYEIGVRLESIVRNGVEVPLYAALSNPSPPPVRFFGGGTIDWLTDLPAPFPRNVGLFFVADKKLRIKQIDAAWTTISK